MFLDLKVAIDLIYHVITYYRIVNFKSEFRIELSSH